MPATVRRKHLQSTGLLRSLFVALLLVAAQQGAFLHELSHYAARESTGHGKKQHPRGDVCELCLAFAQIGSAAPAQHVAAPLPVGLSHEAAPVVPVFLDAVHLPAERSRGPPRSL